MPATKTTSKCYANYIIKDAYIISYLNVFKATLSMEKLQVKLCPIHGLTWQL